MSEILRTYWGGVAIVEHEYENEESPIAAGGRSYCASGTDS